MSASIKREISLLKHEEAELVRSTHYPAILELDREGVAEARRRLTTLRNTERTFARQKAREARGKADARGGGFPGSMERPLERKQVFASALRRVNKQAARLEATEARAKLVGSSRRALAMRRGMIKHHPDAGRTPGAGMASAENIKGGDKTPPAKVGSVSQANKNAQARRDNR